MSSLLDKLKMAAKSAKSVASNAIEGKELTVTQEVFNKRMSACHECPKYLKATNQCGECLCFLSLKGKLKDMECPLHKWPE